MNVAIHEAPTVTESPSPITLQRIVSTRQSHLCAAQIDSKVCLGKPVTTGLGNAADLDLRCRDRTAAADISCSQPQPIETVCLRRGIDRGQRASVDPCITACKFDKFSVRSSNLEHPVIQVAIGD